MPKRKTHLQKKRGDEIKVIVKSNELVEAKYMFNIWETRFFLTLISLIDKDDEEEKTYRVWFKDIKKNFNINSNKSYELLREAARSLNRKPVYMGWLNDNARRGREYALFKFVDFLEVGQNGMEHQEYVDVRIQDEMKPFLLHVKKNFDPLTTRYTSYDLRNAEKLKPYAIRMYELLKQFEYKGFRTIKIQDLKEMFLITNEYPRFSTFNQSVITPSIKAINKHTDIYVPLNKIEKIKRGRRVDALRFPIQTKTKSQIDTIRNTPVQGDLFSEQKTTGAAAKAIELFNEFQEIVVGSFGVTPVSFMTLLSSKDYSKQNIEQAISVTRRAKFNQEIKKNIAGFFIRALQDGYTDPKEEAKKKQQKEKAVQAKKLETQKQMEAVKAEKVKAINDKIRELVATFPNITLEAIEGIKNTPMAKLVIEKKELALGRPLTVEDYRQDKILREFVKGKIIELKPAHFSALVNEFESKLLKLEANF